MSSKPRTGGHAGKRSAVPGTDDTSWTDQSGEPGLTGQPGQAEQPGQPEPPEQEGGQGAMPKPDEKPV